MSNLQAQAPSKTVSKSRHGSCTRDVGLGLTVSVLMIGAIALLSWAMTLYTIANPRPFSGITHYENQQR